MAYRFGHFILDPLTGTLAGPSGPVPLRRQTFRLCEVLVAHAPELLDRETLLNEVWGHTALSPNVLPQTMSELRQALGDDAQAPRFIETVHRRGYRVICPVERLGPEAAADPAPETPTEAPTAAPAELPADNQQGQRPGNPAPARLALIASAAIVLVIVALFFGTWQSESAWRTLHERHIPAIRAELETDVFAAWRLARETRDRFPGDPVLEQLWLDLSLPVPLTSDPPGATVEVGPYGATESDWVALGETPLADVRLPLVMLQFRVSLPGHRPLELAPSVLPAAETFHLHADSEAPEGMVYVPAGRVRYLDATTELPGFWIQRREVTNREFHAFVAAGGYQQPEFWRHPAEEDGALLDWEALMARFVDRTGQPGPATWLMGTYPEGTADHPVEGISWHEAAAYAEFAGQSLPTVFHWWRAAGFGGAQATNFSDILAASNFSGRGARPTGQGGLGPFGTYDMAGNVAEWCANPAGDQRHMLGGSWLTDSYTYRDPYAHAPLERRPGFGFRLIQADPATAPDAWADIRVAAPEHVDPASDETFAIYARQFEYDPRPLNARVEEIDDSHEAWRRERISFDAAYGGERVLLQLFLPRNARPPFQAVVHFPGGDALMLDSSRDAGLLHVEPFLRTGRAVAYPVYQGTFERRQSMPTGPIELRDQLIHQVRDARRVMDYLETRADIDPARIAFHGLSYGGWRAPYLLAVEDRFATAMIVSAGTTPRRLPPEIAMQHYLPRVRLPLLFITGRHDFSFALETSQQPFFEQLGTRPEQKQHIVLDWGHLPPGYAAVIRELIAWTDQWLGPVPLASQ